MQEYGAKREQEQKLKAQATAMAKRDAAWVAYVGEGTWAEDPKAAYQNAVRVWGPKDGATQFQALQGVSALMNPKRDPEKDQKRMDEVSPILLVDRIKAPVLLIHGADDAIVPIAQSKAMKRALDKAGHKTELLEIAEEGHSYWSNDNEKLALSKIDAFLWTHLGPGAGVTAAPVARGQSK